MKIAVESTEWKTTSFQPKNQRKERATVVTNAICVRSIVWFRFGSTRILFANVQRVSLKEWSFALHKNQADVYVHEEKNTFQF